MNRTRHLKGKQALSPQVIENLQNKMITVSNTTPIISLSSIGKIKEILYVLMQDKVLMLRITAHALTGNYFHKFYRKEAPESLAQGLLTHFGHHD